MRLTKPCFNLFRERFNSGARYKERVLKWDTIIGQKNGELGRFLIGKRLSLDFVEPEPTLEGSDDRELRIKILRLTQSDARRLVIANSTIHYLRKRAACEGHLKIYRRIAARLREG